jgi:hypothetical protein
MKRNYLGKKSLAIGIILLFVGASIIPATALTIIKNQYITTEEIQIRIEGGIGYRISIYNPYNTSFNATLNVTYLFTLRQMGEDVGWLVIPYSWTGTYRILFGFGFISARVVALDKTVIRNGIVIGPFVIFGPYN